jgi:transposase InsO family protein
VNII